MTGARVLVVDDDVGIRTVVREALRRVGYRVETAGTLAGMRQALASFAPQLLVTDVVLPDGDGLDALPRAVPPGLPVIVLSAQNTLATAVRATEQGAFDYLPKPFDLDELTRAAAAALARGAPADEAPSPADGLPLIGRSPPMQEVYRTVARVVGNDLGVLILGESGTGKELVARAIHDLGPRAARPFVAVNMAAIPRELIESELFGHERGAFTGAVGRIAGRFEQADGGTLFLDEIGDMPSDAQTRLLRVLQSGEVAAIGAARPSRVDVRIIAATHQDLPRLIADGLFREDLYYRLNVVPISLPPLRRRGDDLAELSRHFLERAAAEGLPRKRLSDGAVARLAGHDWPGNVRELENIMRRLAALTREEVIDAGHVAAQLDRREAEAEVGDKGLGDAVARHLTAEFARHGRALPPDGLFGRVMAEVERPLLHLSLAAAQGNQLRAARLLGINRNTLRKKLAEHGIEAGEVRRSR